MEAIPLFNTKQDKLKNQTLSWRAADQKETYKDTLPDGSANYSRYEIVYRYNSHGFRADEFTEESDLPIVFAGCSFTEGIGLPLKEVWHSLILDKIKLLPKFANLKIPHWNLGVAGAGIDTVTRVLYEQLPTLKPKHIFGLMLFYTRREFCYESNEILNLIPSNIVVLPENVKDLDLRIFTDDYNAAYQLYKNLIILNLLADQHNVKINMFSIFDIFHPADSMQEKVTAIYSKFPNINFFNIRRGRMIRDYARDGMHPGPLAHSFIADQMWEHIGPLFNGK